MITIFARGSRRSKGVPSCTGAFLRLLLGEMGTPKLAHIFAYGKWLYLYRMLLHGASDPDQKCLKTQILRTDVVSHQISSLLPPKSHPKSHFGGPFNAKLIIQRALRKSQVNGSTKLKLYCYIGIGKYLGCVKIYPLGGIRGAQGSLMYIWDPLLSRKPLELER